jgi:hypothetical protein
MSIPAHGQRHREHAFESFHGRDREGLAIVSRRGMLKAGLAGVAGLTVPDLLRLRATARAAGRPAPSPKSLILLWMAGGPSHIDTWDPKPDRPLQNRGPFGVIPTKLPGVFVCEHLPQTAAMLDQFTIVRSVDARLSNHEPNTVFQTGNRLAEPRTNPEGRMYPAIGSIVAKHHGPNHPGMPAYVAFLKSRSHLAFGGYLGKRFDPFLANDCARLPVYDLVGKDTGQISGADFFTLPSGLTRARLDDRETLRTALDGLRRDLDANPHVAALDGYHQQALDLITGPRAREAFDLEREPPAIRDRYGAHLWCQQALLARRLVEAGAAFVTLDLSYHTASGTWDNHGDNIPPYGGISRGLRPLLPLFDHLITTLVADLDDHGLLDRTLVLAMGEFGRTPVMGTQGSTDGRDHWPVVMSMLLAGGGLRHGQVIGSTEPDGGHIASRPVTPADLAATIYQHFGVPLDTTYTDPVGRPRAIVDPGGGPIAELF